MKANNIIKKTCPFCGKINEVVIPNMEAYNKWVNNEIHIQEAFPNMTADDRELLITGICSKCWDNMFSAED